MITPFNDETALEEAIATRFSQLTNEWQSFGSDSMSDAKRNAMQRLILSGLAKTRLAYRVEKSETGEWFILRFILRGHFLGNPITQFIAAQCPSDWFDRSLWEAKPGISFQTEGNDWTLAITDDGERLRKLPDNRALLLQTAQGVNSAPVILKDGVEHGLAGTAGDGFKDEDREMMKRGFEGQKLDSEEIKSGVAKLSSVVKPGRRESPKRKNMSVQIANDILLNLLRKDPSKYAGMSGRDLADEVGCSRETLRKTDAYDGIEIIREELKRR